MGYFIELRPQSDDSQLRELLAKQDPLKFIRLGTNLALDHQDLNHYRIALEQRLPLIRYKDTFICDDAGKIMFQPESITVFDRSIGLLYQNFNGDVLEKPNSDILNGRELMKVSLAYEQELATIRQLTCQLVVIAMTALAEQHQIYWTMAPKPNNAIVYQAA